MKRLTLFILALLLPGLVYFSSISVAEAWRRKPPPPARRYVMPSPPPHAKRPARPHPGWIWVDGYWVSDVWYDGFWRPPVKEGYVWVPGHYNDDGVWIPAHWKPL